jgi:hypothetical protein
MRIIFMKGKQREFFNLILEKSNCPSLRELSNRININYSTIKNYYIERRLLGEELFNNLCILAGLNKNNIDYKSVEGNWGQVKGGRKSKR